MRLLLGSRASSPSCVCSADVPPLETDGGEPPGLSPCSWELTPRRSTPTPAGNRRSPNSLRRSAAHRGLPAPAYVRGRRRRTTGAVPRSRGVTARSHGLAAGAGALLAPRYAHVLAPADSVVRRAVGAARHPSAGAADAAHGRALSAPFRDRLDAQVAVDDDQPHSPPAPHQGQPVEPIGWWHEAAAREAGMIEESGLRQPTGYVGWRPHATSLWCGSCIRRGATPFDRSFSLDDMPKAIAPRLRQDHSPLRQARRGAAGSRRRRYRLANQTAVGRARGAVARGPFRPGALGRGGTARRASRRPPRRRAAAKSWSVSKS